MRKIINKQQGINLNSKRFCVAMDSVFKFEFRICFEFPRLPSGRDIRLSDLFPLVADILRYMDYVYLKGLINSTYFFPTCKGATFLFIPELYSRSYRLYKFYIFPCKGLSLLFLPDQDGRFYQDNQIAISGNISINFFTGK